VHVPAILGRVAPVTGVRRPARNEILEWYGEHGRPLAFRKTSDPWAILVSEVMAQQTQATRAAAYWERFMTRFPTVDSVAAAAPADVLREWQGLGYDRRAVALWRAAVIVVERHGGRVPSALEDLEALPGVGPYTARAVAALAFGAQVGAIDVNVRRVLGRIVAGGPEAISAGELQRMADAAVPPDRPGIWTHALMDLGASVCRPRVPHCADCPARPWCAFAAGDGRTPEPAAERASRPSVAFATTKRWLRGRILDRLRAAPDGEWVVLEGPIGMHDAAAIDGVVERMATEGVVEVAPEGRGSAPRARLPLA
jgi:A/G-specific adenine glycosylase